MCEKDKANEFISICINIAKALGLNCVILTNGASGCTVEENFDGLDFKGLKTMIPDIVDKNRR